MRIPFLISAVPALVFAMGLSNTGEAQSSRSDRPINVTLPNQIPSKASNRSPNVIVIMTDDVGFGASSTFGGLIDTPTLDALAKNGVRYNNFHTTALCSPTRAALLTGRNAHAVGMGMITERSSADPGYTTEIPKSAAMVSRVLRENGYHTAAFGKYHLIPKWEMSPVGPRDHWPTSMGFDHFYGFEPSFTDLFTPNIIENTNFITPPNEPDYHFEKDIADRAIQWLRDVRTSGRGAPFFMYYATGIAHAPVQAPAEWIAKYHGKFDNGWDAAREEIFARQKKLGVIPDNAVLTERTKGIPAWNTLSTDQQKMYARHMEVVAGALSFTDHQIGRVLDELKQNGELNNTIVFYIQGDNGASGEGGLTGYVNYYNAHNFIQEDPQEAFEKIDLLGGPDTAPAPPRGWTNAMSTPFRHWKANAEALGGVRNGLAISWPDGMETRGKTRRQFHSINDIVPTIYEAAGVIPPDEVDGVRQQPITGISMVYTFDTDAPSKRKRQYFETFGTMSIYKDGWWANYRIANGETVTADLKTEAEWELYNLQDDFSQSKNIAKDHPEKLAELKAAFREEGISNNVFPITQSREPGPQSRIDTPGRYVYYADARKLSNWSFPNVNNRSWSLSAKIEVSEDGGTGVVINQGGKFAGWGLVFINGAPHFIYKTNDSAAGQLILTSGEQLEAGSYTIDVNVAKLPTAGGSRTNGASITMKVDGDTVASGQLAVISPRYFAFQGAAVGRSNGSPLTKDYTGEFEFNGKIEHVALDLAPR